MFTITSSHPSPLYYVNTRKYDRKNDIVASSYDLHIVYKAGHKQTVMFKILCEQKKCVYAVIYAEEDWINQTVILRCCVCAVIMNVILEAT